MAAAFLAPDMLDKRRCARVLGSGGREKKVVTVRLPTCLSARLSSGHLSFTWSRKSMQRAACSFNNQH